MTTTINPMMNGGPSDDDGPMFPAVTGRGMFAQLRELQESKRHKSPKKIFAEAEGVLGRTKGSRPKKTTLGPTPKNLRASGKKKKRGLFGEAYQPPAGNTAKGKRVAESRRGLRRMFASMMRRRRGFLTEKAPPGWEGTVKHMKKHKDIDNPFALAWHMKNEGDTPHH